MPNTLKPVHRELWDLFMGVARAEAAQDPEMRIPARRLEAVSDMLDWAIDMEEGGWFEALRQELAHGDVPPGEYPFDDGLLREILAIEDRHAKKKEVEYAAQNH